MESGRKVLIPGQEDYGVLWYAGLLPGPGQGLWLPSLLAIRGWCLWKCSTLNGDIIVVVRDESVTLYPEGYPVYTEFELEHLCQDGVTEATSK